MLKAWHAQSCKMVNLRVWCIRMYYGNICIYIPAHYSQGSDDTHFHASHPYSATRDHHIIKVKRRELGKPANVTGPPFVTSLRRTPVHLLEHDKTGAPLLPRHYSRLWLSHLWSVPPLCLQATRLFQIIRRPRSESIVGVQY